MTLAGWIIMLLSVSATSGLLAWCIFKVLTIPEEAEHIHGFEQKTPDTEEDD